VVLLLGVRLRQTKYCGIIC